MEYHEIRYFISVMRMLNFTQAAIHCNVTQPALTRAIQKLEDRVGGQLFCRERGNVHLTELGRALAPHFLASAEAAGAALATAAQFRRLARADVRIEVATSVDPSPLAGFLAFFHQRHPGIALTPIERDSDGAGERLLPGQADLAILPLSGEFAAPLRATPLYEERCSAVLPSGHPLAATGRLAPADVAGHRWLTSPGGPLPPGAQDVAIGPAQPGWLQAHICAGLGFGLLPLGAPLLDGLSRADLPPPGAARTIGLVTVAGRRWSRPAAAVIEAIGKYSWPRDKIADAA